MPRTRSTRIELGGAAPTRRRTALLVVAVALAGHACSVEQPQRLRAGGGGQVREVAEAFSSAAQERTIPIRVVQIVPNAGAPDPMAHADLLRNVQAANEVFKAAGVQFWVRSKERWVSATFADFASPNPTFGQIKADLQAVFPNMPSNAWADSKPLDVRKWLRVAATRYATRSEIMMWVPSAGLTFHQGFHPEWGSAGLAVGGGIEAYRFAHELGHTMGVTHTHVNVGDPAPWQADAPLHARLYDPATLAQVKPEDFWDLVYKPGAPNTFYSNWASAAADSASLVVIDRNTNCGVEPNGTMKCTVNGSDYFSGDPAMKGLSFTYPSSFGPNVSSYDALDNTTSHGLSDSQIYRVRRYLRYEMPTPDPWKTEITDQANGTFTPSSFRPLLGDGHNREASYRLDFDHDGRRDIGVWIPPTDSASYGQFIVLLSTQNFSTSPGYHLNVAFGRLGDIPVPADYNGDGYADVAVFQPGGGLNRSDPADPGGWWRWCTTNTATPASTTCGHDGASPSPIGFGGRWATPLPGLDFDGNAATSELAYYSAQGSQSVGEWSWRTVSSSTATTRYMGGLLMSPLPGLYDYDWKTDIAVYDPANATFWLARSELGWSTSNLTYSSFGSQYVAQVDSNPGSAYAWARGGSIPLTGVTRSAQVCVGRNCWYEPRRAFSLWSVDSGTWVTKWDVFGSATPVPCQWGVDYDIPVVNIDRDNDRYTEMAIFRASSFSDPAWLSIKNANGGSSACNGTATNQSFAALNRPRNIVFGVADMTGDGKSEILVVEPDILTVNWVTSDSGYTAYQSRTFGTQRAVVL